MLSCADATKKLSESLDRQMGWAARLGLRMHTVMCGACRRFGRQIRGLDRIVRDGRCGEPSSRDDTDTSGLSAEKREEIKRRLQLERAP